MSSKSPKKSSLDGGSGDTGVCSTESSVLDTEESLLSPIRAPGVLHSPEVLSVIITNQQDSVIRSRVGAIVISTGDDTAGIGHEETSIQGDGEGSLGRQDSFDLIDISADGFPVGDDSIDWFASLAGSFKTSVGILRFVSETMVGDDISVSQPGETSSTTTVAKVWFRLKACVGAINDPLFGERDGGSQFLGKSPLTLNVLSGGESPARSTTGLVLDSADNSGFRGPIESCGFLGGVHGGDHSGVRPDAGVVCIEGLHEDSLLKFLFAQVTELVHCKNGLWVLSVQFIDSL